MCTWSVQISDDLGEMAKRIRLAGRSDRAAFSEVDDILHQRYKMGQDVRARVNKYKTDRGTLVVDLTLVHDESTNGAAPAPQQDGTRKTPPSASQTDGTHFSNDNSAKAEAAAAAAAANGQENDLKPQLGPGEETPQGKGRQEGQGSKLDDTPSEGHSARPASAVGPINSKDGKIEGPPAAPPLHLVSDCLSIASY